ncbi:MAG: 3-dehydroquinate synthase [Armatimonadia bacterium]
MSETNRQRVCLPDQGSPPAGTAQQAFVVPVRVGQHAYDIHVSAGLLDELGKLWPPTAGKHAAVISAATVAGFYADRCLSSLQEAGWQVALLQVPDGEASKTLAQAERLYEGCLEAALDRSSTIFALGGGVVGDLAGFVAATYMRGLPFVQVPTTLLAQVDASVGGKTAVDLPRGKNLVGAFHQPSLVAIDVETLQTLPDRELRAGMAEIVKHAAIADEVMFEWLEQTAERLLGRDMGLLSPLVARNCQIKAAVVEADPLEKGMRACLNYGHTVGHAVEVGAGEWDLRHGEALAWGMVAEARLAVRLGLSAPEVAQRQERLLQRLGLLQGPLSLDLARAKQSLLYDKKAVDGAVRLPLVPEIGRFVIQERAPMDELVKALEELVTG